MNGYSVGSHPCNCTKAHHDPQLIAVTGGPGAGKTAVLEIVRRTFCSHVGILPEAAGIVFGGGFPRHDTEPGRIGSQLAIFHVQRMLEYVVLEERQVALALCDRGTLDGLAYWPGTEGSFFERTGTTKAAEQQRYALVVHLRSPAEGHGYNLANSLRIESAQEAADICERIKNAWQGHPNFVEVAATEDFMAKAKTAVEAIHARLPDCCHTHGRF